MALVTLSCAMMASLSVSAHSYKTFENEDNSYRVISGAFNHNFINSGHVARDCSGKSPCRYAKSQDVRNAQIDTIWVYNKKDPYYRYDSAHSVIYESSNAFNEKDVYCLSKGASYRSDNYKLLRFNRHIIGVEAALKRTGKILCSSIGIELPASVYGDAGDIMPLFFN